VSLRLHIRIVRSSCDGLVYAVCAPGSWKPLMTFLSRGEALEAIS
jgi:hypothetical protein